MTGNPMSRRRINALHYAWVEVQRDLEDLAYQKKAFEKVHNKAVKGLKKRETELRELMGFNKNEDATFIEAETYANGLIVKGILQPTDDDIVAAFDNPPHVRLYPVIRQFLVIYHLQQRYGEDPLAPGFNVSSV